MLEPYLQSYISPMTNIDCFSWIFEASVIENLSSQHHWTSAYLLAVLSFESYYWKQNLIKQ